MKRKFRNKSWLVVEPSIFESKAYKELSGKAAVVALIRFHQKSYKKHLNKKKKGFKNLSRTNDGEIIFTYEEAEEMGIKSSSFYNVLRELIEDKGFINITHGGGYYTNDPNKYAISERWQHYGTKHYDRVKMPPGRRGGFTSKNKT